MHRAMPRLMKTFAVVIVSSLALVFVTGALAQESTAMVRVVHASPDAPAVDVYVDGTLAIEGLAFPNGTDYVELPAGEHQVQVTPAGSTPDEAVIDAPVTVEGGAAYTIAAVGLVAEIQPLVLQDNLSEPEMGKAHVRIVHASPDAPAVDVAVSGGPVLFENLAFPTGSDYLPVDAGTYDLEVRPTGTEDVALAVPGFVATAGDVYTIFAVGQLADGTLSVAPFVDASYGQSTGSGSPDPAAASEAPSMPNTGAGGMAATESGTNWTLIAGGLGLLIITSTAGGFIVRRAMNS